MAETCFLGHRVNFMVEYCVKCGVPFALTRDLYDEAVKRGPSREFYCPNGHRQWYGKGEADRLKEELAKKERALEVARQQREWAEQNAANARRSAAAYRGKITKIKNRIKNGVCPCCNRHFENLQRHMAMKHPKFKGEH